MLPINFTIRKALFIFILYLFYYCYGDVLVTTTSPLSVVVAKPTNIVLDFLLMPRVACLELVFTFPYILASTLLAGCQVDDPVTVAIHFLSDWINFAGVCTFESFSLV